MLGKTLIQAASGSSYWISTIGSASSDEGYGVTSDASGNVYICGEAPTNSAAYVAKFNPAGLLIWQRQLAGFGNEFRSVAVDATGNVYVCGTTGDTGQGNYNELLTVKFNSSGTIQWQKRLKIGLYTLGWSLGVDGSGNVYVTGYYSAGSLLVKYNTSGTLGWARSIVGGSNTLFYGLTLDSSGNIYITGTHFKFGSTTQEILLLKFDSAGNLLWQRGLFQLNQDYAIRGITVDSSGDIYICGTTPTSGMLLVKNSSSGSLLWQQQLSGAGTDHGYSVSTDSSGNVYVCGETSSQGAGVQDFLIAKFNTNGSLQWQRTLGGTNSDRAYGITVDTNDDLFVIGTSVNDILLTKLPNDGSPVGTYGSIIYSSSLLTSTSSGLSSYSPNISISGASYTEPNSTFSAVNPNYTPSITHL